MKFSVLLTLRRFYTELKSTETDLKGIALWIKIMISTIDAIGERWP